ncbi:glycosyltransferase family 4 protein [Agaribacter flavus]|uniref:Glycosyltransferase family 4 protein n=1 Tax=Agaribacter flavus TaxID=1902781 RepID=A0ABV7FNJ2_9ALTE
MKYIGFFSQAPFISGAERCLQIILHEINQHPKFAPILFVPAKSPMIAWAASENIPCVQIELLANKLTAAQRLIVQAKIIFWCIRYRIQVIHSNQIWTYKIIPSLLKLLGIKTVVHLRDPIDSSTTWWFDQGANAVVSISSFIKKSFSETFPLYSGLNAQLIDPINKPQRAIHSRAKDSKIVIGFIGQIRDEKGLFELVKALEKAKLTYSWQLRIAGCDNSNTQAYIHQVQSFIDEHKLTSQVEWLGFVNDLDTFYDSIDIVVVPSKQEPLGLIPLEAAIRKRPAIISAVGGLVENVQHNTTGFIFQDYETDLIDTLRGLNTHPLERMGEEAHMALDPNTSPKQHVSALLEIFEDL